MLYLNNFINKLNLYQIQSKHEKVLKCCNGLYLVIMSKYYQAFRLRASQTGHCAIRHMQIWCFGERDKTDREGSCRARALKGVVHFLIQVTYERSSYETLRSTNFTVFVISTNQPVIIRNFPQKKKKMKMKILVTNLAEDKNIS